MTNRLQKIEKAIKNMSDDKFNDLLNELGVKEEEQWVPDYTEWYWTTMATGEVGDSRWENDVVDNYRLLMNNVFKTEEEAIAQRDFNIEKAKLIKEIEESSDVIDWGNNNQKKYKLHYNVMDERIYVGYNITMNEGTLYTTNKEWLREYIKDNEANILKHYFEIKEHSNE